MTALDELANEREDVFNDVLNHELISSTRESVFVEKGAKTQSKSYVEGFLEQRDPRCSSSCVCVCV